MRMSGPHRNRNQWTISSPREREREITWTTSQTEPKPIQTSPSLSLSLSSSSLLLVLHPTATLDLAQTLARSQMKMALWADSRILPSATTSNLQVGSRLSRRCRGFSDGELMGTRIDSWKPCARVGGHSSTPSRKRGLIRMVVATELVGEVSIS